MRYALVALILFSGWSRTGQCEGNQFRLVPSGRLFPITIADPREIRTAVAIAGSSYLQANVGSYLSFFSVEPEDLSWSFHFGIEGKGMFSLRQEGGRFPLDTVDGTFGLYAEYAAGPWAAQVRYTHVSAHFADGNPSPPIAYSRETLSLRGGYSDENLHVYAGIHRIGNSIPAVHPLALQVGVTYFVPTQTLASPFLAADLRWQEETRVNPSFALQLGVALHESDSYWRSFRLYYSYYTGADVRGQFYLSPHTVHAFGIELPL